MCQHQLRFIVVYRIALSLVCFFAPALGSAVPELPDETFAQKISVNDHPQELAARVDCWRHIFQEHVILKCLGSPEDGNTKDRNVKSHSPAKIR